MKSRSLVCLLTLGLVAGGVPGYAQNSARDALVLANVGTRQITRRDLTARLVEYRGDEALDKMIGRVILQQEAKRLNLSISEEELDLKMREIQTRFQTEAAYRQFLLSSHLKESQLRDETRNTLLLQKVALLNAPIKDEDLEQFDVRMIVAADKATAEKWIKELEKTDFIEMASKSSVDPKLRQARGKLAPFIRVEMLGISKAIDAGKLKPGDYTKTPVALDDGQWGIVRLERRLPVEVTASPAERERLVAMVTAYRVDQWMTQARAKAQVDRLGLDKDPVAKVNGQAVSREQLTHRLLEFYGEEALQQMANREVLLQAAHAQNTAVTDQEADTLFKAIRQKFGSEADFQTFLTRSFLTEKQLRDEVRYNTLMERVALKESPVTDEDLQQYDVRLLTVANPAKGEEFVKKLDEGEDFGRLASFYSLNPDGRVAGGRMRPFLKIDMLDVWRAMDDQGLKPGKYTKKAVLLTDNSYVLIKLENIILVGQVSPSEKEKLRKRVVDYRVAQWLNQARSRTKVAYPVPLETVLK
jgi:foldase protein PrsA